MIYHILRRSDWDAARQAGMYEPESLRSEGFIHCSTAGQTPGTVTRYFGGEADLILLGIDELRLAAPLRWEHPSNDRAGELFPHIYGALNLDAVVEVGPIPASAPPASQSTSE